MNHIALYRSWRPQKFKDIVGQEHITRTLQNSLKQGRLTHAYLFSGPRGTGKTSAAKILAKAVNCERGPAGEPCNECETCIRITEGSVMDVIELDAASNNGVDEIRDIRDKVKYAPTEVRQKVYIIDEVHMLSIGASNALLKTLEEPPAHVMFILATTEPHKLPVTIISRCQRYDFRRVALEDQIARLDRICREEGITAEQEALQCIARLSDGGMRDALSLLDQIVSFAGNHITYQGVLSITGGVASDQFEKLATAVKEHDIGAALQLIDNLMQEGKSADKCMESLIQYFRDLLMIKMVPGTQAESGYFINAQMASELAGAFANEDLFQMIDILNRYQVEMKYASQPQTLFEVALMKICSMYSASPISMPSKADSGEIAALTRKVEQLERQLADLLKSGAVTAAAGPAAEIKPRSTRTQPAAISPVGLRGGKSKLDAFLLSKDESLIKEALSKWPQILNKVKELKITVHAWLMDGEPVSAAAEQVLVAFKNTIHRETTEKPANKQLIEQVLSDVFRKPLRLETVMIKDWTEAASGSAQPQEILQLEPEDQKPGKYKEDWINEAIELFGEDMVVIKDE